MKNIVLFASGSGTNVENIIRFFDKSTSDIRVSRVFTNNSDAGVIERSKKYNVPVTVFDKETFNSKSFLNQIESPDLIVLAGFLWLIPEYLINAFPDKIINIHPALLPKYGGKGMYGSKVHESVIENGEQQSGITIHFVNKKYDEGEIILQAYCKIDKNDDADKLARKIHKLEYAYFPVSIQSLLI